jgi:hypothetical protein
VATTHFDHSKLNSVAYYEGYFARRLHFNSSGWAQVSCPLHSPDREPSLSLHRDGGFKCFACGAHGGDIIEFEHLLTGRDRRAIAQGLGAWLGRPVVERPRPPWARSAPRPTVVKDPVEKPKLTAEFFEAARLNFPAILAEAHHLCDLGYSVHAVDAKAPRGSGWQLAPRKSHELIELQFQPRLFDGVMSYPNLGFRIDLEPAGDAPNLVTDVDIRTEDQAEIGACMAAVNRHMGDRKPDAVTGRGGLHFYDQRPLAQLARIFGLNTDGTLVKNVFKLDWAGCAEGIPHDNSLPWTIEMFSARHNVLAPPSVHPLTLRFYQRGR